jgi:predicted nucleic acid-binding protein
LTRLVIDASAALYALAAAQGTARLRRHDVVAPPLLWSEATASIRQRVYRSELSPALAGRMLDGLTDGPITRVVRDDLYAEAYTIAGRLGWAKTYDAEYVALARLLGCPLLTADARLARGAAAEVEIQAPLGL